MAQKNKRFSYLIPLLLVWLIGCFLQYQLCCQSQYHQPVNPLGFKVTGLSENDFRTAENITFQTDSPRFNPIPVSVITRLDELREFLDKHPEKSLEVTGYYLDAEKNNAPDDLGTARAKRIREWLVASGFHRADIVLSSQKVKALQGKNRSYRVASSFALIDSPQFSLQKKELSPVAKPFAIKAKQFEIVDKDNFNFFVDGDKPLLPLSDNLNNSLKKAVDYLNTAKNRQMTIVGLYHPNEKNTSLYSNLGLSRANQIKNYLIDLGANGAQLNIEGKAHSDAITDKRKQYLGMAEFYLTDVDNATLVRRNKEMATLAKKIKTHPLTLYFETGDAEIQLTQEQREFLIGLIRYINFNPNAKASVTGHTDNTGEPKDNIALGKKRAKFAADYLVTKGLNNRQIQIVSQGENKPIAGNDTAEGRAKNRRVVISIIEKTVISNQEN